MKTSKLLFLILFLAGCDSYFQDDYRELVVVEAYAVANQPLPDVFVSTTMPADEEYQTSDAALNNAIVQITLLGDGVEAETFSYERSGPAGIYRARREHFVLPERTYRLDVRFNDRPEEIRAFTTVPEDFGIQNEVRDTVVYQSEDQLELVVSAPQRETESQRVYVVNAISLSPEFDNLTPFYRNAVEDENAMTEDFENNSSGLINEANFDINPDGSIRLQFPWLGVAFFEDNLVVTNSVDKNLSDFIRSQDVQLGGSTLPPGEIPNLLYNVEGGIGVFGSVSSDTVKTFFKRPF